ncbi:MAG TPA: hypothetical protein VI037_03940 [Nitrososphaera sp.]
MWEWKGRTLPFENGRDGIATIGNQTSTAPTETQTMVTIADE